MTVKELKKLIVEKTKQNLYEVPAYRIESMRAVSRIKMVIYETMQLAEKHIDFNSWAWKMDPSRKAECDRRVADAKKSINDMNEILEVIKTNF